MTLNPGSRRPLGVGSGGVALLAAQSERFIEKALAVNAARYADYLSAGIESIRSSIEYVREAGFGINNGQINANIQGIGLALENEGRPAKAAISIAIDGTTLSHEKRLTMQYIIRRIFPSTSG